MQRTSVHSNERGIALLTTLLILMMMSALLIGFTSIVTSDQRYRFIDHDRGQAFYAAGGAVEKLTVDVGNLFLRNLAPTGAQVLALTTAASQPPITNVTYVAQSAPQALASSELSTMHCYSTAATAGPPPLPAVNRAVVTVGGNGYAITYCANTATNAPTTTADPSVILTGAYGGLVALKTPYQIDVTAKTATGGEVHLIRSIEAVTIPVFQFGIFSDVDLAFNAADDFSFGGRVHTNGNLFLSQGGGSTLTLSDKVTALKEVVRQRLSNGNTIDSNGDTGTVNMAKGGGTYTAMDRTWGSVVDGPTSALNEPTWTSKSIGTYKGYIRNGRTGVKPLNLPMIAVGGTNTDLVRRPLVGEDTTGILFNERLFSKASIRVLLSDKIADIMNLPTIDATAQPKSLEAGAVYGGTYGSAMPIATSPGPLSVAPVTSGGTVSSGTGKSLQFASPYNSTLPSIFTVSMPSGTPVQLASGSYRWNLSGCTTKTQTTFTSTCTIAAVSGAPSTVPSGATLTYIGATATTTASVTTGSNKTVTFASTLGLTVNTFWINDQIVTCTGYTTATSPPVLTGCTLAQSVPNGSVVTNFSVTPVGTSPIGGYIKIERQNATDGAWHDITPEILSYGIGAPSETGSCSATDPSPNAILRLQRLADDAGTGTCLPYLRGANPVATDYWPQSLFDQREAWQRDTAPADGNIRVGGVMYYVSVDAANLSKWFTHTAPYSNPTDTGAQSKIDNTGFSIYISDRRNNRNALSQETAEYGWEDFVNPLSATAVPNGTLDAGEDLNVNGVLDVYGGVPNCNGTYNVLSAGGITCNTGVAPYTTALRPIDSLVTTSETLFNGVGRAMVNRPLYFRRAIKLINGGSLSTWVGGFTAVTENPVYVQGDWNANGGFTGAHAATAVIADAVTVLSSNWSDTLSFSSPYSASGRSKRTSNSYYRMAILAGKSAIFPWISGTSATFGTDGGAHSFIRFLEDNAPSTDAIHYKGSLATFYYNRQAVGIFKGTNDFVYGIPALRDYTFDVDFQQPSLLPPLTPAFRDINAVGFSQELRPGK